MLYRGYTGTTAKLSMNPDDERICQEELGPP